MKTKKKSGKTLRKSGKSQGIWRDKKSGNPDAANAMRVKVPAWDLFLFKHWWGCPLPHIITTILLCMWRSHGAKPRATSVYFLHNMIFTGRNEVVAKVMFLIVSVILSTGGGVLSQHALQVVSQHALHQVSRGVSAPGGSVPRGCLLLGGVCFRGVSALGGVCSQGVCLVRGGVAFCYGLLVWWPSGWKWSSGLVAFWSGGLLVKSGLLVWWPSVMAFWFGGLLVESGLLVWWPSGLVASWLKVVFWFGGLLIWWPYSLVAF